MGSFLSWSLQFSDLIMIKIPLRLSKTQNHTTFVTLEKATHCDLLSNVIFAHKLKTQADGSYETDDLITSIEVNSQATLPKSRAHTGNIPLQNAFAFRCIRVLFLI